MSSEWRTYRLYDVGRIVTGKTPKSGVSEYEGCDVPFISPPDFSGVKWIEQTARCISEAGAQSVKGSVIPPRSVLVTCIGSDMCAAPLNLLERKGHTSAATFHLSKGVATVIKGKAAYTRARGLNPVRYAELVREYLSDHQRIDNAQLRELLGLGDSPSAQVEASRFFKKWCLPEGFLTKHSAQGKPYYTLR